MYLSIFVLPISFFLGIIQRCSIYDVIAGYDIYERTHLPLPRSLQSYKRGHLINIGNFPGKALTEWTAW